MATSLQMNDKDLKEYLDFKANQYNNIEFINSDPIQLVHQFDKKEDIEIVAFLIATIAWGKRQMIIKSGEKLLKIMGDSPYDFIINYSSNYQYQFVHRTFNAIDLDFFFRSLQNIYKNGSLESCFTPHQTVKGGMGRIITFREIFLATPHDIRSEKHLSNPLKNSAAKRLNMFLRWMVRDDKCGVDFGIWKTISPSELNIPLDVHTGNISRELGLITRKQNDGKALEELMTRLREFNPKDPAIYDFALFGIGAFES
jgi:uncharacterized protein (TIGR02757 family)